MRRAIAFLLLATTATILWNVFAAPAHANFCKSVTTERARNEARLLENERFAVGANYIGDRVYNADIISCNRKRDSNGNNIEKSIVPNHQFAADLEARSIKGKYNYYATAPLAYAYELRREGNHWIVRIPIRFHWPTSRKTDMIDISKELVNELADPALSSLCAAGATVFDKNNKDVARGNIPIRNPKAGIKGTDTVNLDELACRVPRSTRVAGESILRHLREFYANSLTRVWNRPGFRIEPVLLDHGEGSEPEINAWDKDGITWELRLNLHPDHRASYKRWLFKWNNMYTGVPAHVIAHEFGHKLGLDDEYGWGPNITRSQRDCANRRGTAPFEYIMCNQIASWDSTPGTDDDIHDGAKAVYPWIVTRRYAIAKELTCKEDTDCGTGSFCAKGALGFERNECQAVKSNGGLCDRAAQCSSDRCVLGSCAAEHECLTDRDCGTGYCKTGLGDLDRNSCHAKLADWQACTGDHQCQSGQCSGWRPQDGQVSGICYTPNSKQGGESCKIDLECAAGACNSNKRCVCKRDGDCSGNNQWCDHGVDLHENSCRTKLDKGEACGKYGDLSVSRRCKSGKCSTKTGLGVPGVTTLYCQ